MIKLTIEAKNIKELITGMHRCFPHVLTEGFTSGYGGSEFVWDLIESE